MVFVKGQSGNPAGRPKGRYSITSQIIKFLEDNPDKNKEVVEWLLANRKDLVWKMIDPEPPKDLNLGGVPTLPFIIKIMKSTEDEKSKNEETSEEVSQT